MRAQYPSSSTSPRAFLKAHHVLGAMAAAILVTAAVAVSVGAWQLTDGSDDSGRAAVRAPEFNFDRVAASSSSPSIPVATFDELVAMHEALTSGQFGDVAAPGAAVPTASTDELLAIHEALIAAQALVQPPGVAVPSANADELLAIHEALMAAQQDAWNNESPDAPSNRLPGEGGRGHVTID